MFCCSQFYTCTLCRVKEREREREIIDTEVYSYARHQILNLIILIMEMSKELFRGIPNNVFRSIKLIITNYIIFQSL